MGLRWYTQCCAHRGLTTFAMNQREEDFFSLCLREIAMLKVRRSLTYPSNGGEWGK